MSYPLPFFFLFAFGVSASSWTHISRLRSSPLMPLFFKYLTTVFPVFCTNVNLHITSIYIFSFPHLPVGERPLPLAGSGLVFGLDDHDTPLRGAQLAPVDSCKQEQILTGCSFTFIE